MLSFVPSRLRASSSHFVSMVLVTGLVGFASSANAQVKIPKKKAETKALEVLLGTKKKEGKMHPPMMKAIDSKGTMTCKWTAGKLWIACDIDEKLSGGSLKNFLAHFVVGWDYGEKGYRANVYTITGNSIPLIGWREGDKLIFQSQKLASPLGKMKVRWTFDLKDPKAIGFLDERSINGMAWFKFEETKLR